MSQPSSTAAVNRPPATPAPSSAPASSPPAAPVPEDVKRLNALLADIDDMQARGFLTEDLADTARSQAVTAFVDARARPAPGPAADAGTLRDYFDSQEQRRLHPWREAQQRFMAERDSILSAGRDQLLAVFADMAKQQLLSPEDAWFLHVLLSGDEAARLYAIGLVLRHPTPQARFERFNLAGFADQGFLAANGDAVLRFQAPLFPSQAAFAVVN